VCWLYIVCMLMQPMHWPNIKIIEARQAKICNNYKIKDAQYLYWNNWVNIFPCNPDTQLPHYRRQSKFVPVFQGGRLCWEETAQENILQKKSCTKKLPEPLCPVCLEGLKFHNPAPEQQVMSTQCGHVFCYSCVVVTLNERKECPMCCKKQTIQNIHPLYV